MSSLSEQLIVPQNPTHHPEGNVRRHTIMVRAALRQARTILMAYQMDQKDSPFSNLDLNLSQVDWNLVRIASLLHDIGKSITTDRVALTAHGHEMPEYFEQAMRKLGKWWHHLYETSSAQDREDLWFVIRYHMSLDDREGFRSKSLKMAIMCNEGKYLNSRKVKALLLILIADRMGRGGGVRYTRYGAKRFAEENYKAAKSGIAGMLISSHWCKGREEKILAHQGKPMPDDPFIFVDELRRRGKSDEVIAVALRGKFKGIEPKEIKALLTTSSA